MTYFTERLSQVRRQTRYGGDVPWHPHQAEDITGGTFSRIVLGGDIVSENWDGARNPVDLSGGVDSTATTGFAIDTSVGRAQFQTIYAVGGILTNVDVDGILNLVTGAVFRTGSSGNRVVIQKSAAGQVDFYTGDAAEVTPGDIKSSNARGAGVLDTIVTSPMTSDGHFARLSLSNDGSALFTTHDETLSLYVTSDAGSTQESGVMLSGTQVALTTWESATRRDRVTVTIGGNINLSDTGGADRLRVADGSTITLFDADGSTARIAIVNDGDMTLSDYGGAARAIVALGSVTLYDADGTTARLAIVNDGNINLSDADGSNRLRITNAGAITLYDADGSTSRLVVTNDGNINFYDWNGNNLARFTDTVFNLDIGTLVFLRLPVKTDTGDPSSPSDGDMYVNTFDNKVRVYADAAWRDLATW